MSYEIGKDFIKKKLYKKALLIFQKILKNNHYDLRANFQMGKIYYELNNLNKSIFFFKKCNKIQPNTPNILFNLALALQSTGKISEAKENYLNLISMNPSDVKSYYGLFILNDNNINSKFQQNLQNLNENNKISLFEKSLINFIFSKIKKKEGDLKNEIKYLKFAHQFCLDSNLDFNNQSNFYYENIISNHFNKIDFHNNFYNKKNFNEHNHIFIVGLPRSGSTLVETILSHNAKNVVSVGEFHGINTSILEQIGNLIYSINFNSKNYNLLIDKKKFQDSLIEKYNNFEKKIFLDKSLENFFNIDLILQFFPNAKFIHTYRNQNDAIIGIYQTMLPELSWSHKIQDIKNYINSYKKTINYFKKKYSTQIIDVELSNLTRKKEIESKKILDFCNISYKNNYLDFNKNKELFNKTNSFLQVRNRIKEYENKKYQPYYYLLD